MKRPATKTRAAFTLVEMLVSLGCGSLILAVVVIAGVAMQRSFAAVEAYSTAEGNQLRVLDYIAMDCRRAIVGTVGTLTTPAVDNGSFSNGSWVHNSSGPVTLILNLPVYYNSSSSNTPYVPTLGKYNSLVSYGSGSVTVSYQQSGSNFTREVIVQDSNGNTTSDTTTTIANAVTSFTVTPVDQGSTNGTLTCNIMFFPTFTRNSGSGTWRSGPSAPNAGVGSDGDWYVIDPTASAATTVGNVYYRSSGAYSLLQNIKATQVYCSTFLRNTSARQ